MRAVMDTNVLLSALLFPVRSWLRDAWQSDRIVPLASRVTMAELLRVLHYPKFRLTAADREDLLADYLPWVESVVVSAPPPVPRCRDPKDRPFLELALAGRAEALITGDGDLQDLASCFAVPILAPSVVKDRVVQALRPDT